MKYYTKAKPKKKNRKLRATKSKNFSCPNRGKLHCRAFHDVPHSTSPTLSLSLSFTLHIIATFPANTQTTQHKFHSDHLSFSYAKSFCPVSGANWAWPHLCYGLMRVFIAWRTVYYDYYLCRPNPQLLKRSLCLRLIFICILAHPT